MMGDVIIKYGEVASVDDEADAMRIKVRLKNERFVELKDLPYAFPLLPKYFQSMPKVGETVMVFNAETENQYSQRFYVGPVISQPQYMGGEKNMYWDGTPLACLQNGSIGPEAGISHYDITQHAFPDKDTIAIIGRSGEDIQLKDGEVAIRCGARKEYEGDSDLSGPVARNDRNPSYIQLKHKPNLMKGSDCQGESAVNVVGDAINLVTHKNDNPYTTSLTSKGELIQDKDMDALMSQLHAVPYGDVLVKILETMRNAISMHLHPFPGMYPNETGYVAELNQMDFNKVNSKTVRVS